MWLRPVVRWFALSVRQCHYNAFYFGPVLSVTPALCKRQIKFIASGDLIYYKKWNPLLQLLQRKKKKKMNQIRNNSEWKEGTQNGGISLTEPLKHFQHNKYSRKVVSNKTGTAPYARQAKPQSGPASVIKIHPRHGRCTEFRAEGFYLM